VANQVLDFADLIKPQKEIDFSDLVRKAPVITPKPVLPESYRQQAEKRTALPFYRQEAGRRWAKIEDIYTAAKEGRLGEVAKTWLEPEPEAPTITAQAPITIKPTKTPLPKPAFVTTPRDIRPTVKPSEFQPSTLSKLQHFYSRLGISDIAKSIREMVAPTTPYAEKEAIQAYRDIPKAMENIGVRVLTLGGITAPLMGLKPSELRAALDEDIAELESGFAPALIKPTADTVSLAIQWGYLYPKLFRAVGTAGSLINKIPQVQKGISALKSLGGIDKIANQYPKAYTIASRTLETFAKGAAVGAITSTPEAISEDLEKGEFLSHISKSAATLGGIAAAFQLVGTVDTALYAKNVRETIYNALHSEYGIDLRPKTPPPVRPTGVTTEQWQQAKDRTEKLIEKITDQLWGIKRVDVVSRGQETVERPENAARRAMPYITEPFTAITKAKPVPPSKAPIITPPPAPPPVTARPTITPEQRTVAIDLVKTTLANPDYAALDPKTKIDIGLKMLAKQGIEAKPEELIAPKPAARMAEITPTEAVEAIKPAEPAPAALEAPPAEAKPIQKMVYTSAPEEWYGETLYDWGRKGLRSERNKYITDGGRRKTFAPEWRQAMAEVPVGNQEFLREARKRTDEVWPVKKRRGKFWVTEHYLIPKPVVEQLSKTIPVQPAMPVRKPTGEVPAKGIFGQPIFEAMTGNQIQLPIEEIETRPEIMQAVPVKKELSDITAKALSDRNPPKNPKELYLQILEAGKQAAKELFINSENPMPEVITAWNDEILGRRMFGAEEIAGFEAAEASEKPIVAPGKTIQTPHGPIYIPKEWLPPEKPAEEIGIGDLISDKTGKIKGRIFGEGALGEKKIPVWRVQTPKGITAVKKDETRLVKEAPVEAPPVTTPKIPEKPTLEAKPEIVKKDFGKRFAALSPGQKAIYKNALTKYRQTIPYDEAKYKALERAEDYIKQQAKATEDLKDRIRNPKLRPGFIRVPIPEAFQERAKAAAEEIKDIVDSLRFYPKAPMELRNAIRIKFIGARDQALYFVHNEIAPVIWGDLGKQDIQKSIEIIWARDQVSRTALSKGNPEISLEQAQKILEEILKDALPEAMAAADRYNQIMEQYRQNLVDRGVLSPDQHIEFYARHYIVDYTPKWAPVFGIPRRLRKPFRGYAKKAVGTTKEYRQDKNAILDHFMEVEYDNIIDDFLLEQLTKYNKLPELSREQRAALFGVDKAGRVNPPRPGRIVEIEGKRYRTYSPDAPFSRTIFPTESGLMALGKYKHVVLLSEEIYNVFREFSQRGSRGLYYLNLATRLWKTQAILTHFPTFNLNNLIGDTWMAASQHPQPLKLLKEIEVSLSYLTTKEKAGYLAELEKFINNNAILTGLFARTDLYRIIKSRNPLVILLRGAQTISEFRETIMRVAYASTLLKALKEGQGDQFVKYHNWIDTEGLSTQEALGKISRDVLVDYGWASKTFDRIIRGGLAPFGTWYSKASNLMWQWGVKKPWRFLLAFLVAPIAAALWNYRNQKSVKTEMELPDYVRNRVHVILGENLDGSTRVLPLQLPQDVLIGTKIFSVLVDYSARVAAGEMSPRQAALMALKRWGIKEAEGIAYLASPWIRCIQGLIQRRDPYDKAPIYPTDPKYLNPLDKGKYEFLYFIKCSAPFLAQTVQSYQRGLPRDIAFRKLVDRWAGWGALGIFDVNKKTELVLKTKDGRTKSFTWDNVRQIEWIRNQENKYLGNIERGFIDSEQIPAEFVRSSACMKELTKIYRLWANFIPALKTETDTTKQAIFVVGRLGERFTNRLSEPSVLDAWYTVKLERAKTDKEKQTLGEQRRQIQKARLIDAIKQLPKTAREAEFIRIMQEHEMPWELIVGF